MEWASKIFTGVGMVGRWFYSLFVHRLDGLEREQKNQRKDITKLKRHVKRLDKGLGLDGTPLPPDEDD